MEETFYEMLERTRLVDQGLFWLAVILPPVVALTAAALRARPSVERYRHRWVLAMLAAPGLLLLWKAYNAITDHFGLESVRGLLANVCLFAAAALVITALRLLLKALLSGPSMSPRNRPEVSAAPEFRPYKAGMPSPGLPTTSVIPASRNESSEQLTGTPHEE